jgi:hypothetical protein
MTAPHTKIGLATPFSCQNRQIEHFQNVKKLIGPLLFILADALRAYRKTIQGAPVEDEAVEKPTHPLTDQAAG